MSTHDFPRTIPGTRTRISEHITLSIRLDRTFVVELGKHVVIIFSAEEAQEVFGYLMRFRRYFSGRKQ